VDLIALAERVVCNDSGLMHIAAALDRRLVAVFGSTSPDFTPPLGERSTVLQNEIECSPCFQRQCPLGHMKCLETLMPEQVIEVL
jgi:heptosyltransferase-2